MRSRGLREKAIRIVVATIAAVMLAGNPCGMTIPGMFFSTTAYAAGSEITLSKAITINSSTLSQYNNKTITGSTPEDCMDTFYAYSENAIKIDGVTVNLTLKDFQVPLNQEGSGRINGIGLCNGAVLNLTLEGTNAINGCYGGAAIWVPEDCTLTITENSTGSLTVKGGSFGSYGACAIGASSFHAGRSNPDYDSSCGTINICGGTIVATPGVNTSTVQSIDAAAAIGIGSSPSNSGKIRISGGTVKATGGRYTSAIGGGHYSHVEEITISGGTVEAYNNIHSTNCATIGCGYYFTDLEPGCGTIRITGGQVYSEGGIGIGELNTAYGTASGSVYIDDMRASVNCSNLIYPVSNNAEYANCSFEFTVYDESLVSDVANVTVKMGDRIMTTGTLKVTKKGVGKITCSGLFNLKSIREVDFTVSVGDKVWSGSTTIIGSSRSYKVYVGNYRYGFNTRILDNKIKSGTTLSICFVQDAVAVVDSYSAHDGYADVSGYIVTDDVLTAAAKVYLTDSANRAYTLEFSFPSIDPVSHEASFSGTDGYRYEFSGKIFDDTLAVNASVSLSVEGVESGDILLTSDTSLAGVANLSGSFTVRKALSGKELTLVFSSGSQSYSVNVTFSDFSDDNIAEGSFLQNNGRLTTASYVETARNGKRTVKTSPKLHYADDSATWEEGWYVVDKDFEATERITVSGTVHLILIDGKTLHASKGIAVTQGNTLMIYGQEAGTGKLYATNSDQNAAAIGANKNTDGGTIVIYSGEVEAEATHKYPASIGGAGWYNGYFGDITIYGGKVNAIKRTEDYGKAIGSGYQDPSSSVTMTGGIHIYGGEVIATTRGYAIGSAVSNLVTIELDCNTRDSSITLKKDPSHNSVKLLTDLMAYNNPDNIISAGSYSESQTSSKWRNIVLTAKRAMITKEPTQDNQILFDGSEHELITPVEGKLGTPVYSLNRDGTYTANIPKASAVGEYTVWYYIKADQASGVEYDSEIHSAKAIILENAFGDHDGTQDDPYEISSALQWNFIATTLEENADLIEDKYYKFTNDITVSTPLGTAEHPFHGTVDGDGHTLTFNCIATGECCAPFSYAGSTTIMNLHIDGYILTDYKYAAGIVGYVKNNYGKNTYIKNCLCTVTINSTIDGEGRHGGLIGNDNDNYKRVFVYQCHFNGKLLGEKTTYCAGILGSENNYADFKGVVFDPQEVTVDRDTGHAIVASYSNMDWLADSTGYFSDYFGTEQSTNLNLPEKISWVEKNLHSKNNSYSYNYDSSMPDKLSDRWMIVTTKDGTKKLELKLFKTKFDIYYELGGGENAEENPDSFTTNTPDIILADPFREYYIFDGWYQNADFSGEPVTKIAKGSKGDITLYAKWSPDPAHFSGTGSENDPYVIHSDMGWELFCDALQDNDRWNRFVGKYVKLDENISATRIAGYSNHDFCGQFDGNGKTLTFAPRKDTQGVSPFGYVSNGKDESGHDIAAAIRNLNVICQMDTSAQYAAGLVGRMWGTLDVEGCSVTGTIKTGTKFAAGFVGEVNGTLNLTDCHSGVEIESTVSGDATNGGLAALIQSDATVNVKGCVFDGKMLGNTSHSWGGFIGWRKGTVNIWDSLFAPATVEVSNTNAATFVRNGVSSIANTYYLSAYGDLQGAQARWISAGEDVNLQFGDGTTTYTVSELTAYEHGLMYQDRFYAGEEEEVALTPEYTGTPAADVYFSGFTAGDGTLTETGLTVPAGDVIVKAELIPKTAAEVTAPVAITGLIYNGLPQTLIQAGSVVGGTMQYALTDKDAAAPEDNAYGATPPETDKSGSYYVWYKVIGDTTHLDTEPAYVEVTIRSLIDSYSLSLDGDIGLNFYLNLTEVQAPCAAVTFTWMKNGEQKTENVNVTKTNKGYKAVCRVSASEIGTDITAHLVINEGQGSLLEETKTYSVAQYAEVILTDQDFEANYSETPDLLAKLRTLVSKMLVYGDNAKAYFDKSAGAVDPAPETSIPEDCAEYTKTGLPNGVSFEAATLSLKSKTTLSLYFIKDAEGPEVVLTMEGKTEGKDYELDQSGNEYVIRIRDIAAAELGDNFTVKVNGTGSVTYSPLTYCWLAQHSSSNQKLVNTVKALYDYYVAAKAYFGTIGGIG